MGSYAAYAAARADELAERVRKLEADNADLMVALAVHSGIRDAFDLTDDDKQAITRALALVKAETR